MFILLYIQDPSFENSKYLHETLLAECVGCVVGAGAYAFATKDGINLLFEDDNFKRFLGQGTYTLVVGTDDITNEHSINALIDLKKKYQTHLQIKAYVHNGKGSTFHPKISWFQKENGGSLVVGSGNLTQKGLRHNREMYNLVHYNEQDMEKVVSEWNRWYSHSSPFLFDIEDPIVMTKAKLNTEKTRVISVVKTTINKTKSAQDVEESLIGLYQTQPKDIKKNKRKDTQRSDDHNKEQVPVQVIPIITDVEYDIDASYWKINNKSSVLIAEIPRNGSRWKQANFDMDTFESYFGATCGENGEYRILLKNVNADGSMNETEIRPSVSVSSSNYRFELEAANGLDYPDGGNRPIAIFAKVSRRDFIYMLLMPGQENYNEIITFIGETKPRSARMRRLQYVAKDVVDRIPTLAIWNRLEKEEKE